MTSRSPYPDRSSLVRAAIDRLRKELAARKLRESAQLYAELYAGNQSLERLTDAATEDWPE